MCKFSIFSKFTKKKYDIHVYIPEASPPPEGFPIFYVLDGLSYFSFVRDIVHIQQINYKKTGILPAIVVGICHQKEEMKLQRFIDFTPTADKLIVPPHAEGKIPENYGGAEQFFQFLQLELMPQINTKYEVDKDSQTIIGHSLGGYFSLWCLLKKGRTFTNYVAISPSVWWNNEEILTMAKEYIDNCKDSKRVFIAVGEKEGFMVDGAKKMVTLLEEKLTVQSYVAQDENHASVVPTVLSRALRFCNYKESNEY